MLRRFYFMRSLSWPSVSMQMVTWQLMQFSEVLYQSHFEEVCSRYGYTVVTYSDHNAIHNNSIVFLSMKNRRTCAGLKFVFILKLCYFQAKVYEMSYLKQTKWNIKDWHVLYRRSINRVLSTKIVHSSCLLLLSSLRNNFFEINLECCDEWCFLAGTYLGYIPQL